MSNKVVVWNKVFRKGELIFKLISLTSEYDNLSLAGFRKKFGDYFIMKELFNGDIECPNLSDSLLYKKYQEVLDTEKDNDTFCKMYKIKDDLAVSIDAHIILHHITNLKIGDDRILPWECIDSKIYIADTWWETDEDILKDLNSLSLVDFLAKYKGY